MAKDVSEGSKFWREAKAAIFREYGLRAWVERRGRRGYGKLVVEVGDERLPFTIASSPKNRDHAVLAVLREVRRRLERKGYEVRDA